MLLIPDQDIFNNSIPETEEPQSYANKFCANNNIVKEWKKDKAELANSIHFDI